MSAVRRLTAIMFADIVGYTAMMQEDELMASQARSKLKKNLEEKIAEHKNSLYLAIFVSDQTPTKHESQYFTTFLNQPTSVFLGIEKIAKTTGNPVVFCNVDKVKRGYYEATFVTLFENPKQTSEHEITEAHTKMLEGYIKAKPELWLWSHKRWKFKPEDIQ